MGNKLHLKISPYSKGVRVSYEQHVTAEESGMPLEEARQALEGAEHFIHVVITRGVERPKRWERLIGRTFEKKVRKTVIALRQEFALMEQNKKDAAALEALGL